MVLVHQPRFYEVEDAVKFVSAFLVASQQFLLYVCIVGLIFFKEFAVLVEASHFGGELLLGDEEILVLLEEAVAGVVDDALDADVSVVSFAVEFVGLVVEGAELVVLADLLLLAGELEDDEVFGEHVGLYLRVVLVAAGGAIQKLLLLVDDRQALLAHRMSAVQVPGSLLLRVVELVAHRALH